MIRAILRTIFTDASIIVSFALTALAILHLSFPSKAMSAPLIFSDGACYLGMFGGWGEFEDNVSLEIINDFEYMTGKGVGLIPFSVFFGQGADKVRDNLNKIKRYGAAPIIRLMPWGAPYWDETGYQKDYSLYKVANGGFDNLLNKVISAVRDYGDYVIVTFGVEMNGNWFPWSGIFYNASVIDDNASDTTSEELSTEEEDDEDDVMQGGARIFKEAFRHVVDLFRSGGADNALWMFQVNYDSVPDEEWNRPSVYYPGDDYVDIIGFSIYGRQYEDEEWREFEDIIREAYPVIASISPNKPLIIAEWGVGEWSGYDKGAWYKTALNLLRTSYRDIRAAVVYHERWENADGSFSDLRVNSSPSSLMAYKEAVSSPYFEPFPCSITRASMGYDIYVNHSTRGLSLSDNEQVILSLSISPYKDNKDNREFWLFASSLYGNYYLTGAFIWTHAQKPLYWGAIDMLPETDVYSFPYLPPGEYAVYFGADMGNDGRIQDRKALLCVHLRVIP